MLKINKQLNRPDGGEVQSGSVIKYDVRLNTKSSTVWFFLNHYISEDTLNEGKQNISKINEFNYKLYRECSQVEWDMLNDSNSAELVAGWLLELIENKIGSGYIQII